MKKELKELLNKDEATLKINELFVLRKWTLHKESDFLGREGDFLEIEMINDYGITRSKSIRIESRDTAGIMAEIEEAMKKMMDEFKSNLLRRFKGGFLD